MEFPKTANVTHVPLTPHVLHVTGVSIHPPRTSAQTTSTELDSPLRSIRRLPSAPLTHSTHSTHLSPSYPVNSTASALGNNGPEPPVNPNIPSPDWASRVSAVGDPPNSTIPQLRKKPKTISISDLKSKRKSSGSETPVEVVPSSGTSTQERRPSRDNTATPSTRGQLLRSHTAPLEQSPQRRAPASHSSYGVETTAGPPPSFSTQRTFSQERVWKVDRSSSLRTNQSHDPPPPPSHEMLDDNDQTFVARSDDGQPRRPKRAKQAQDSPDTADTESVPTPTESNVTNGVGGRERPGLGMDGPETRSTRSSSDDHKSEDLFLTIARVDASKPAPKEHEKRRSRISLPFFSTARTRTTNAASPDHSQATPGPPPARTEPSQTYPRSAPPPHRVSTSFSRTRADRDRDPMTEQRLVDSPHTNYLDRRSSTVNGDTGRVMQRTSSGLRGTRFASTSSPVERARLGEHNATESTISTAAPSTVWDELDDIKSRIRKLELTGKLPSSSAAAMATAERPRTATTAATTATSTSPRYRAASTVMQGTAEGVPGNVRQLLQEALENAKSNVDPDVYQKLYASAADALDLAATTNAGSHPNDGLPPTMERQIRRRTENICRSLTELAIALAADTKPPAHRLRPGSVDAAGASTVTLRNRRCSSEPSDRPAVTTRAHSRLESRRASTHHGPGALGSASPEHAAAHTESPLATGSLSAFRPSRRSTVLRNRRAQDLMDGASDDQESSLGARPVSRAMTDIGATRRASRDHLSTGRQYTSQTPLPSPYANGGKTTTPLPTSISANFTSRRKYGSPAGTTADTPDSSPLAARESWGRISIVPGDHDVPDTVSEVPDIGRSVSTRRSLGFASRLGSSVGSRLRAVKAERGNGKEPGPLSTGDGTTSNGLGASEPPPGTETRLA